MMTMTTMMMLLLVIKMIDYHVYLIFGSKDHWLWWWWNNVSFFLSFFLSFFPSFLLSFFLSFFLSLSLINNTSELKWCSKMNDPLSEVVAMPNGMILFQSEGFNAIQRHRFSRSNSANVYQWRAFHSKNHLKHIELLSSICSGVVSIPTFHSSAKLIA